MLSARLKQGESLGDRVMKVDHAGEHGAICIYTAQRMIARWRAPSMVPELDHFLAHERRHRDLFGAQLQSRGRGKCRSFHLCGLGGWVLGLATGMLGEKAIAATTVAIERVVLRHMHEQRECLRGIDAAASDTIARVIADEQEHHDLSADRIEADAFWPRIIGPVVAASTGAVIWLGMHL